MNTNYANLARKTWISFLFFVVTGLSQIAMAQAVLQAYLPFNEGSGTTAVDATGNGWNGTLVNGPTWVPVDLGYAVNMNGVNQYVSLPTGVVSTLSDFSATAWVNLNADPTWSRIFDFGSGTGTYMFLTPGRGASVMRFAITTTGGGGEQGIDGTSTLPASGWHHMAVTRAGNVGTLYVDGFPAGQNNAMTLAPSNLGNTTQNWIGRSQWNDPYLNGLVREFRIYRGALTPLEIAALAGVAPDPPEPPTGLAATAGIGQVNLSWAAAPRTSSYNVKRATLPGGPYTTIAPGITTTSYRNTGLTNGTTYYYVVSAVNVFGEGPDSAEVTATPKTADAMPVISVKIKPETSTGMKPTDFGGAIRVSKWNNLNGPKGGGVTTTLTNLADSNGAAVTGVSISMTGGSSAGTSGGTEPGNDLTLFASVYDQFDGTPASINITGIPYDTYDVLFYVRNDGPRRGGKFTVGPSTYYIRTGLNNPAGDGSGYVQSLSDQYGQGSDLQQGNYVRFEGLSGNLSASFAAVNTGDSVQRLKVVGFQIVAATAPAPVAEPPVAPSLQAAAGNGQVYLVWSASNTATQYKIKRSTASGGPYFTVGTVNPPDVSFVDATVTNEITYFYVVSALNAAGESPDSAPASATPYDLNTLAAFSVKLKAYNSEGMAHHDTAGAFRMSRWNNLVGPTLPGETVTLSGVRTHLGGSLPDVVVSYTAGNTGGPYDASGTIVLGDEWGNEMTLFATGFNQYNGDSSQLTVSGIPYRSYDVLFYVSNDGPNRGGSITVGCGATRYLRTGLSNPISAIGYVESTATEPSDSTPPANYIRFRGLSGDLSASVTAVNYGGDTQRFKIVGFQIISNERVIIPPVTAPPPAPTGLQAFPGDDQVGLKWHPAATATSYKVKRNGSVVAVVNAPWLDSPTSYFDLTAMNGTDYSYAVSAVNAAGEGADSASVRAAPQLPEFEQSTPPEWQYSVVVTPRQSEYVDHVDVDPERRAYLWVPPASRLVRGVVFGLQNMIERQLFETAEFRQRCAEADLAIILISPGAGGMDLRLDPNLGPAPVSGDKNAQAALETARVLDDLAVESGYTELHYAPVMFIGHSAASPFTWANGVYAKPALAGRVAALISYKGWGPAWAPPGIPILHVSEQWAENPTDNGSMWDRVHGSYTRRLRGQGADVLLSEFVEVGVGHYQADSSYAGIIALFAKKAGQYRIPASFDGKSAPVLTTIDPTSGWLIDERGLDSGAINPVSYDTWMASGIDPLRAFWYFDEEQARAVASTMNDAFSKKPQMVAAIQPDGSVRTPQGQVQYSPTFLPDGVTFRVRATALSQAQNAHLFNAQPLDVSVEPVRVRVSSGGLRQVGPDTFQVSLDRNSVTSQGNPWEPWLTGYLASNAEYRAADRPIHINIPIRNGGTVQTITFPDIPDQTVSALAPIPLHATASSGLPVQYWMVSGPYTLDGNTLIPQPVPVKVVLPMRVIVGAYQWGKPGGVWQSAGPVFKEFFIRAAPPQP